MTCRPMMRDASETAATHVLSLQIAYRSRTHPPICRYFVADFGEQNRSRPGETR